MYMWCADFPQDEIMFVLGMGGNCMSTVIDGANFMRHVCQELEIHRRVVGLVTTVNS